MEMHDGGARLRRCASGERSRAGARSGHAGRARHGTGGDRRFARRAGARRGSGRRSIEEAQEAQARPPPGTRGGAGRSSERDRDDVAALIRFLCGPESSWITGQCIAVDGGHTLRRGPDVEHWARAIYGDAVDGRPAS